MKRKAIPPIIPQKIFNEIMKTAKAFTPRSTGSVKSSITSNQSVKPKGAIVTLSGTFQSYYLDELYFHPQIEAWRARAEEFMKPIKVIFT